MKQISKIMWGVVLVFLGVVFSLNALEITDVDLFFKGWWTLLIIIPSFISLFTDNDKTGGIIGFVIGLMLLLACRGYFDIKVAAKLIIPAVIIFVGLELIFKDAFKKDAKNNIKTIKQNSVLRDFGAAFTTKGDTVGNGRFDGVKYNVICGTINGDYTNANIEQNVLIKSVNVLGNITIKLPENVNVDVTSHSLFGGVANRRENNASNVNTVYVQSYSLLGNVEIN